MRWVAEPQRRVSPSAWADSRSWRLALRAAGQGRDVLGRGTADAARGRSRGQGRVGGLRRAARSTTARTVSSTTCTTSSRSAPPTCTWLGAPSPPTLLEGTEAVGLWPGRRWAEYLTFVATVIFVQYEVYELTKTITAFEVLALVINLAIVAYLLFAKRLFGLRGGGRTERAERE
jgi:hypothetical protein